MAAWTAGNVNRQEKEGDARHVRQAPMYLSYPAVPVSTFFMCGMFRFNQITNRLSLMMEMSNARTHVDAPEEE